MHEPQVDRVLIVVELLGGVEGLYIPAGDLSGRLGGDGVVKDFVVVVVTCGLVYQGDDGELLVVGPRQVGVLAGEGGEDALLGDHVLWRQHRVAGVDHLHLLVLGRQGGVHCVGDDARQGWPSVGGRAGRGGDWDHRVGGEVRRGGDPYDLGWVHWAEVASAGPHWAGGSDRLEGDNLWNLLGGAECGPSLVGRQVGTEEYLLGLGLWLPLSSSGWRSGPGRVGGK